MKNISISIYRIYVYIPCLPKIIYRGNYAPWEQEELLLLYRLSKADKADKADRWDSLYKI